MKKQNIKNDRVYFDADTRGMWKDQMKGELVDALARLKKECENEIAAFGKRETQMVCRFYLNGEDAPDYWNLFVYWEGDHYNFAWQQWYNEGNDVEDYFSSDGQQADVLHEIFYTTFADSEHGAWPTWQHMTDVWVEC